jgi:CubicO group peptidase (beta-lactamase class C family)
MSLDVWRPTEVLSLLVGGTPYALYSTPKVKELLAGNRLLRPPGVGFSYSNLGFGVLGLVLAEGAGLPYEQLLANTITRPLGLNDTGSRLDASAAPRLAPAYRGYFRLGPLYLTQTATPANFGDGLVAAGGVYSSGRDMLRFLAANLNPEAFPGLGFLHRTHPTLYEEGETRIGMGWFVKTLPDSRQEILYHSGLTGGHASFVGIDLENRLGVVLLGNVSRPVDELGYAVLEELMAKFAKAKK